MSRFDKRVPLLTLMLILSQILFATSLPAQSPDAQRPAPTAFFNQHCIRCHGPEKQEGELRLDTLTADFSDSRTSSTWIEVRDKLNLGEMPPADEPQPDGAQVIEVATWIAQQLRYMQSQANSTGGGVLLRRLSRTEYINTVRDLLRVTFVEGDSPREILPPDGRLEGFDKLSKVLLIDPSLMDKYFAAARLVADRAIRIRPDRVPSLVQRFEFEDTPKTSGISYLTDSRPIQLTDNGLLLMSGGGARTFGMRHPYNDEQIPVLGKYAVRVRAGADAADSGKPVYMDVRFRAGLSKRFEVQATIGEPRVYEWVVNIDPAINGEFQVGPVFGNPFEETNYDSTDLLTESRRLFEAGRQRESLRLRAQGRAEGIFAEHSIPNPGKAGFDFAKLPKLFVDYIEIEGPLQDEFPAASTRYLLADDDRGTATQAREILARLLPRAFRRPLRSGELDRYVAIVTDELKLGESFDEALKVGLVAMLCSPDFLYLFEGAGEALGAGRLALGEVRDFKDQRGRTIRGRVISVDGDALVFERASDKREFRLTADVFSDDDQRYIKALGAASSQRPTPNPQRPITDFELATRLSYFLWSSMPDDTLLRLAVQKQLSSPATLTAQVNRMLDDPKSEALVTDFATQWLRIREFDRFPPDRDIYRDTYYDGPFANIDADMEEEARAFFREVLQKNESVLNFLDSDWLMVNEKLAAWYGLPPVRGEQFRRVPLPADSPRGGIIGMAGFHKWGADGNRTKPVERGKYILSVLFNDPPDPPPPNAGEVEPNIVGENLTVRDRLLQHQKVAACAGCHRTIDPYGLAMENFSAVGLWRDKQDGEKHPREWGDRAPPIINEGTLPNGKTYTSFAEFKSLLSAQQDRFVRGLAEKLFVYALGRSLEPTDRATIDQLVAATKSEGHSLKALIRSIARTRAFQTK